MSTREMCASAYVCIRMYMYICTCVRVRYDGTGIARWPRWFLSGNLPPQFYRAPKRSANVPSAESKLLFPEHLSFALLARKRISRINRYSCIPNGYRISIRSLLPLHSIFNDVRNNVARISINIAKNDNLNIGYYRINLAR